MPSGSLKGLPVQMLIAVGKPPIDDRIVFRDRFEIFEHLPIELDAFPVGLVVVKCDGSEPSGELSGRI